MTTLLDDIAEIATNIVAAAQPVLPVAEALLPAAAPALELANKLLQGAIAGEPAAQALVTRITSGEPVTASELLADVTANEGEYAAFNDDLKAQIAQLQGP